MATKILIFSFYLLFFLTPLVWAPWSFELFEYNKMMFVYALTIIITTCWLLKIINHKSLILNRTPLDIPLLLFLGANIISTIFSIDRHTSIWGYYSRSNGGLLSLISYLLLYYALVSNFDKDQVLKFLKWTIYGGVAVALYAIPEHFGVSPSCVFLTGNPDAACWVQDVKSRVFATLGQPNWLAAYLAMLIFPTIYFLLSSTKKSFLILNSIFLILFYMAFTFTYSRGATLGLIGGMLIFLLAISTNFKFQILNFKKIAFIISIFFVINLIFGSALTDFKLLSKFAPTSRPSLTTAVQSSGTQLENGGTESGQIRLIVWQGAIDIFKHYPIFGSGLETFAYSYYNFRPQAHNLVSEWDFLYNKAHNEFLNYLATTGFVGFISYFIIFITFIIFIFKNSQKNSLLAFSILASYISYLIQNLFGFSVVIIALFFYLFPAIAFIMTDSTKTQIFKLPSWLVSRYSWLVPLTMSSILLFTLLRFYLADTNFASSNKAADTNPGKAYNELLAATSRNPGEPYYHSELAYAAAAAAVALESIDATRSSQLKEEAITETKQVLKISPKNVSYWRTAARTYYLLSTLEKSYTDKTLEALDKAITLAPTDAKLTYNKAIILGQMEKNKEGIKELEKTIALKPNYKEAYYSLGLFYQAEKQTDKAIEAMTGILKFIPGDLDALAKIKEWE